MGNRSGGSRRKQRENAYTYTDNRRDDYSRRTNDGSINRRQNQPHVPSYQSHSNGYGGAPAAQTTNNNYNRSNSSKIIY